MDLTLKKFIWALPLLVIIAGTYMAAVSANNVVRVYLMDKYEDKSTKASGADGTVKPPPKKIAPEKKPNAKLTLNFFNGQDLTMLEGMGDFGADGTAPISAAIKTASKEKDLSALMNEIECGRDLLSGTSCLPAPDTYGYLIGTIVSTNPKESSVRVLFKDNKTASFDVGKTISSSGGNIEGGAKVVKVCRRKTYVFDQGKIYCITSQEDSKRLVEKNAQAQNDKTTESDGIAAVSETNYKISKAALDNAFNNMDKLATDARMVPHFDGGKSVGFRVFSIRPGSLFEKIGLKNGDIITRINGMDINSPDKALEIYTKLRDVQHVSLDMKRNNNSMTMEYFIQ